MEHYDHYLGIDIGGTHVKMAIVNEYGVISCFDNYHTKEWKKGKGFIFYFLEKLSTKLKEFGGIRKVGVAIPGIIDLKRKRILEVPAIPELNDMQLQAELQSKFPDISFKLENDAASAALGELYFSKKNISSDYVFITVGTGIGSAAVIDRELFRGSRGNAMEVGHVISRDQKHLEQIAGKDGILDHARTLLKNSPASILTDEEISIPVLISAAKKDDTLAKQVFRDTGYIFGEALVAVIRILDINYIIIGGGISVAFDFLVPGMREAFEFYLTSYYLKDLRVEVSSLGNNAGLLGSIVPFIR